MTNYRLSPVVDSILYTHKLNQLTQLACARPEYQTGENFFAAT